MVFHGTYEKPQTYEKHQNVTYRYLPRRTSKQLLNECAKEGKFRDEFGSCLEHCPLGFYGDYANGICSKCDAQCAKCYGPTSGNCLACHELQFYYGDHCVNHCPDTHYADTLLGECLPCSPNCRACQGSASKCKTCRPKLFLDESSRCISICNSNGSMVAGYKNCLKCRSPCKTCFETDDKSCLSCDRSHRLLFTECTLNPCSDGYFQTYSTEDGAQCRECHSSCATCSGPSHKNCVICNGNTTRRDDICQPCQEGQFLNFISKLCESCHTSCAECTGPTSADCTNCDHQLFLDGSRCLPCCNVAPASVSAVSADMSQQAIDNESNANCCKCYNSVGPCISQEHTRSIFNVPFNSNSDDNRLKSESWGQLLLKRPNAVIAFICIASVIMFVSIFALLQVASRGQARTRVSYREYKKVSTGPSARYDANFERVSLTEVDGEEEDSLFEKT